MTHTLLQIVLKLLSWPIGRLIDIRAEQLQHQIFLFLRNILSWCCDRVSLLLRMIDPTSSIRCSVGSGFIPTASCWLSTRFWGGSCCSSPSSFLSSLLMVSRSPSPHTPSQLSSSKSDSWSGVGSFLYTALLSCWRGAWILRILGTTTLHLEAELDRNF